MHRVTSPSRARSAAIAIDSINDAEPVEWLIFLIFALNVIDAVATLIWVATGLAVEANPLMARLIEYHPLAFVTVKMSLVLLGSILLWRLRERILAVATLVFLFVVYYALLLFHLVNGAWVYFRPS